MEIRTAKSADAPTIARFNAEMALESEGIELDMGVLTTGYGPRWQTRAKRSTSSRNWTTNPPGS